MSIDLKRARAETPGCQTVLHFDSAGAGLMPQAVLDAQIDHLQLEAERGGYAAHEMAMDAFNHSYDAIAKMLNCGPDEIALVENATVAWNMAFFAFDLQPGDRILTAEAEYASNYINYLKLAKDRGIDIAVVPSDDSGQLSVAALRDMIDERVKLITITHIPTNGGLVNPAAQIGEVAKDAGIPYLLDACQSAGQMPLDVEVLGCDLLSATGRKHLRGPRGTGFLYVRRSLLDKIEPPWLDLRAAEWIAPDLYVLRPDAKRFENWEFNVAGVIGLGVAVDYALSIGLEAIEARLALLGQQLREQLSGLPGVAVHDQGAKRCAITTFSVAGLEAPVAHRLLAERDIIVSSSSPASTRLDADKRGLPDMVRASPHYYNSEEEIDRFIENLREIPAVSDEQPQQDEQQRERPKTPVLDALEIFALKIQDFGHWLMRFLR